MPECVIIQQLQLMSHIHVYQVLLHESIVFVFKFSLSDCYPCPNITSSYIRGCTARDQRKRAYTAYKARTYQPFYSVSQLARSRVSSKLQCVSNQVRINRKQEHNSSFCLALFLRDQVYVHVVHSALCTVWRHVYTLHSALCTLHCLAPCLHSALCTVWRHVYTLHSALCTVWRHVYSFNSYRARGGQPCTRLHCRQDTHRGEI